MPEELSGEGEALALAGVDAAVPWDGATAWLVVAGAEALLAESEATRAPSAMELRSLSPVESTAQWDPRSHMATCARVVSGPPPSRWYRLAAVLGSLFAAGLLVAFALRAIAG